jgi:hypothetical protein
MLLTIPIIRLTILLIGMPTVTVGLLAWDAAWWPVSREGLELGAAEILCLASGPPAFLTAKLRSVAAREVVLDVRTLRHALVGTGIVGGGGVALVINLGGLIRVEGCGFPLTSGGGVLAEFPAGLFCGF